MTDYSVSPTGERVPLPAAEDYPAEYRRLEQLASEPNGLAPAVLVCLPIAGAGLLFGAGGPGAGWS